MKIATLGRQSGSQVPLDSKRRAGRWAADRSREREIAAIRSQWPWLVLLVALCVLAVLPLALVASGVLRGVLLGAALSSGIWLSSLLILSLAGTLATRMGASAERWTDAELRALGGQWRVGSSFIVDRRGDIDHVVVGPAGVFVLETKWSAQRLHVRRWQHARVKQAADRVASDAKILAAALAEQGLATWVEPILVLWTSDPSSPEPDDKPVRVMGACVVRGPDVQDWLRAIPDRHNFDAGRVWSAIEHLHLRDAD
jgi:hypothetical protein